MNPIHTDPLPTDDDLSTYFGRPCQLPIEFRQSRLSNQLHDSNQHLNLVYGINLNFESQECSGIGDELDRLQFRHEVIRDDLCCDFCGYTYVTNQAILPFRNFWLCQDHQSVPITTLEFEIKYCSMIVCDICHSLNSTQNKHQFEPITNLKSCDQPECSNLALNLCGVKNGDMTPIAYCDHHQNWAHQQLQSPPLNSNQHIYIRNCSYVGLTQSQPESTWVCFMYYHAEESSVYWGINVDPTSQFWGMIAIVDQNQDQIKLVSDINYLSISL